ncbi:hypothetical protein CVT25_009788 [Psilocybe cyanescens]|uniref:Uncharacterized protein n=1 Tax=Psilocybe cyanescens TaxID=93625 RepID=A0A409X867_PSICY|nr:hypothetical protein CVT25_009788 [Psilocybe cyanescens]
MPRLPDFGNSVLVNVILNKPAEVKITASSFDIVMPQLPGLVDNWRKRVDQFLADAPSFNNEVPKEIFYDDGEYGFYKPVRDLPNVNLSQDQLLHKLRLASTVFTCNICEPPSEFPDIWGPLVYPGVSGHNCLTMCGISPWNKEWDVGEKLPELERIVKMAGLGLLSATAKDVDNLDLRSVCRLCRKIQRAQRRT